MNKKEKMKEYKKRWQEANKDRIKELRKKKYEENKERYKKIREANIHKFREKGKKWYAANKEKAKELRKKWRDKNKNYWKEWDLMRKYSISEGQYQEMLTAQDNKCIICNNKENVKHKSGVIKRLAVDHCHSTGKVRGLLCYRCNTSIGKFEDSIELLESAINYLKKHKENI